MMRPQGQLAACEAWEALRTANGHAQCAAEKELQALREAEKSTLKPVKHGQGQTLRVRSDHPLRAVALRQDSLEGLRETRGGRRGYENPAENAMSGKVQKRRL